jgi:hypothetical protein
MNQRLDIQCRVINDFPVERENRPNPIQLTDESIPCFISGVNVQFYFKGGMFMINKDVAIKILELIAGERTGKIHYSIPLNG